MSTAITVQCTHCSAKLKLKSSAAVGKKAKCPKCQQSFVVAAPVAAAAAPADDPFGGFDDFGSEDYGGGGGDGWDFGGGDPMETNPMSAAGTGKSTARKGAKGKKKGKKGRKGSGGGWQQPALIGGAAVLGLGAIGSIVWAIITFLPGSSGWVAWLPDDTEVVVRIEVADVWNSPHVAPFRDFPGARDQITEMEQALGLTIADIESVTLGMPGGIGGMGMQQPRVTAVIRTRKPISAETALNGIAQQSGAQVQTAEHGGATYYTITVAGATQAAYAPDANTLVIADGSVMTSLIDKGGSSAAGNRFADLDMSKDLSVAYAPQDVSALTSFHSMTGVANPSGTDPYSGLVVGADLQSDVDLELWVACTSWGQARAEARDFKSQFESSIGPMGSDPSVQAIINSISASSSGSLFMVEATIPSTTIDQAIAGVQSMIAAQAVGGIMEQFGGGFDFFGGGGTDFTDTGSSQFPGSDYASGPGGFDSGFPADASSGFPMTPGTFGGSEFETPGMTPGAGTTPGFPMSPGAPGGAHGAPGMTPGAGATPGFPMSPGAPGGAHGAPGAIPGAGATPGFPMSPGAPGGAHGAPGMTPGAGATPGFPMSPGAPGGAHGAPGMTPGAGATPGFPMSPGAPGGAHGAPGMTPGAGTTPGFPMSPGAPGGAHGAPGTIPGAGATPGFPMSPGAPGGAHGAPGTIPGAGATPGFPMSPGAPGGAHGGRGTPPVPGAPGVGATPGFPMTPGAPGIGPAPGRSQPQSDSSGDSSGGSSGDSSGGNSGDSSGGNSSDSSGGSSGDSSGGSSSDSSM